MGGMIMRRTRKITRFHFFSCPSRIAAYLICWALLALVVVAYIVSSYKFSFDPTKPEMRRCCIDIAQLGHKHCLPADILLCFG